MKESSALSRLDKNLRSKKSDSLFVSLTFLLIFFPFNFLSAQEQFSMPQNAREVLVEDEGFIFDNGGNQQNYSDNTHDTLIIRPASEGKYIKIIFDSFQTEECCDKLSIFDGPDALSPLIGTFTSSPGEIIATNDEGVLTLIFESNESINNFGFDAMFKATYPDAGITTEIFTRSFIPGARMSIELTVVNKCEEYLRDMQFSQYLSSDTIFDDSDTLLSNNTIYYLNPEYSHTYTLFLYLPEDIVPGDYYVISRLTDKDGNYDIFPDNNIDVQEVSVVPVEFDLHITEIEINPNKITTGSLSTIGFRVQNDGNKYQIYTKAGFYLSKDLLIDENDLKVAESDNLYMLDKIHTFYQYIQPLQKDILPDGIYYLLVNIDEDSTITEVDENNNVYATQVLLTGSPDSEDVYDHTLDSISVSTDTITKGSVLNVSYTLHSGYYPNELLTEVFLTKDTVLNENSDIRLNAFYTYLASDQQWVFDRNIQVNTSEVSIGQYYLYVKVSDPLDADTSNNYQYLPLYVNDVAEFDLSFDHASLTDSLLPGQELYLTHDIINNGTADIPYAQIKYFISPDEKLDPSDMLVNTKTLYGFSPGVYSGNLMRYKITDQPAGDYYLLCMADYDSIVDETNETNNILSLPFKVIDKEKIQKYDLEIEQVYFPDTLSKNINLYLQFDYFFHHYEQEDANFAVYLSEDSLLDISDVYQQLHSQIESLVPYRSTSRVMQVPIPDIEEPGKYYFIFKADNYNRLAEDDESNNLIIKPVYIRETPVITDIETEYFNAEDVVLYNGSRINSSVRLKFNGNHTPDSLMIEVFISDSDGVTGAKSITTDTINSTAGFDMNFLLPDTLDVGVYELMLQVFPLEPDHDVDSSNNRKTISIGIQNPDIDLLIQNFDIINQSVNSTNNFIQCSYELMNVGTTKSERVGVSFFLSEDEVLSEDDLKIADYMDQIDVVQNSVNLTKNIEIDASVTPGSYYLFVEADPDNLIPETLESNNVTSTSAEIQAFEINLSLISVVIYPDTIFPNSTCSGIGEINNNGNKDCPGFSYAFYLSADTLFDASDRRLYVGQSYGLNSGNTSSYPGYLHFPADVDTGSYYLFCLADYHNSISESNEEDNLNYRKVYVKPWIAEFEITGTKVEDTLRVVQGLTQTFSIEVSNQGNYNYADYLGLSCYFSADTLFDPFEDTYINTNQNYFSVTAGEVSEYTAMLQVPASIENGEYSMFVWLDPKNKVKETDELNNVFRIPVKITEPDVDLRVKNLRSLYNTIILGGGNHVLLSYDIINSGTTSSSSSKSAIHISKDTLLSLDDQPIYYESIPSLSGGNYHHDSLWVHLPSVIDTGRYYIIVNADIYDQISETEENNNTAFYPIYLKRTNLDITITQANVSPESSPGKTLLTLTCMLDNTSGENLEMTSYVHYFLSADSIYDNNDMSVGSSAVTNLYGHSSSVEHYSFTPSGIGPGKYYILFIYDFYNSVEESDKSNNMIAVPYQLGIPGPEFILEDFSADFTRDSMNIEYHISNIGLEDVSQTTYCSLYFSNDSIITGNSVADFPVEPLAAGDSLIGFHTVALPPVNYKYFYFKVDGKDQLDEAGEYNNLYYGTLPEGKADIELNIPFSIERCNPGDTVNVDLEISNIGRVISGSLHIKAYLSADGVVDDSDPIVYEEDATGVGPRGSISLILPVKIPFSLSDGDYMLIFEVSGMIAEYNYQNNTAASYYQIVTQMNTGIEGSLYETVIYPNPASQWLNIKAEADIEEFKIFNSRGMLMTNGKIFNRQHSIPLEEFTPGMYFLVLKSKNTEEVFRFEVAF